MNVAIDLLWCRHGKIGGIESFIGNLLDGFVEANRDNINFILFVSKDNVSSFLNYKKLFKIVVCPIKSEHVARRCIYQELFLNKLLKKEHVDTLYEPTSYAPRIDKDINLFANIHDIQVIHYPLNFSVIKRLWLRRCLKKTTNKANHIVCISDWALNDLKSVYKIRGCASRIYIPIIEHKSKNIESNVLKKYNLEEGHYYYTVSSLFPHKNLITILKSIKKLNDSNVAYSYPLVISGINGRAQSEIQSFISLNHLEKHIIFTGYLNDEDKEELYSKTRLFLFPSVFEGFGMPPIEAMLNSAPVLVSKIPVLVEVTNGLANYVDNPLDENEWLLKMSGDFQKPDRKDIDILRKKYSAKIIAEEYIRIFKDYE